MRGQVRELEGLMDAARRRVVHVWLIVATLLALISSRIPGSAARDDVAAILLWFLGCAAILGLGACWVHARHAATRRLLALVRTDALSIERVEHTVVLATGWFGFGHEFDLHLRSGERLAVGFWTADAVARLSRALQSLGEE